jgi:hypothetical protein
LEQAFVALKQAYEDRSGWIGPHLKVDPRLNELCADSRFADLLRRVGLAP